MGRRMTALLLTLLLTGCAAPSGEAPAAESTPDQTARVERVSSMVEFQPLPEAEVLAAYERAQRVYGWFDLAPLPLSEESAVLDGETYYRVNMPGIEDLEDLRAYLRGVFSQELTDRLLDGTTARIQYRNIRGVLYASGESREPDGGKGRAQVEAERLAEDLYSVNVLVDLLADDGESVAGLESWSFPYAYIEDRWIFTDFRLIT